MTLKSRFEQTADLVEALCSQRIVHGDKKIAEQLATAAGTLVEFSPGKVLIEQGAGDRDVYFLLAGKVQVIVNGVRLYTRDHGVTVGEMSAVNPHIGRSATVEAIDATVAWKLSHSQLQAVGDVVPEIWKSLAMDIASRLEQRNKFIDRANKKPRVFIISAAEGLRVAQTIRVGLEHYADTVIWSDDQIFAPGAYPIEELETQVALADFGIALAEPDDLVLSRDSLAMTPRDNVIFELGFFMSRLGRRRTLLLVPKRAELRLPSDFKGLTPIPYDKPDDNRDLPMHLGPTIDKMIAIVTGAGVRSSLLQAV